MPNAGQRRVTCLSRLTNVRDNFCPGDAIATGQEIVASWRRVLS